MGEAGLGHPRRQRQASPAPRTAKTSQDVSARLGPYGPPWVCMGRALMGRALVRLPGWALVGRALMGQALMAPGRLYVHRGWCVYTSIGRFAVDREFE